MDQNYFESNVLSFFTKDNHGGGGNKMWYSFNWGNVHVIMMDSEHDWQVGSNQHSWLEADLAAVDRLVDSDLDWSFKSNIC